MGSVISDAGGGLRRGTTQSNLLKTNPADAPA
jgi:hypothetical protein